jgi:hypothetical protein
MIAPQKGSDAMKKLGMFGKSVPLVAILVSALLIGSASAAILDYYGRIQTTATVQQSVLVDGYDYSTLITDEFDVSGGCCECRSHYLENTACVSVDVMFDTDITPEPEGDEIFVGYFNPLGYAFEGTSYEIVGDYYPVDITVEDGDCEVTWTFDMIGDKELTEQDLTSDGHWGYGLAISLDGTEAAFQIHNNDGTDESYPWGTHLWSPYYDGSWHSGDENVPVEDLDWVTCTGERYIEDNPEGIFTVTISKCMLGEEFCWAVWFGVGGFWTVGGYSSYPDGFMWQGDVDDVYECCGLMEELDEYVTLLPDERLDFVICYCFAPEIMPGSFVITTTVYPD